MITLTKDTMQIVREQDVVPFRNRVREYATKIGMSLVNQTKLITAASELVRNMLKYASGGKVILEIISKNAQSGVRLTFVDEGPGIENVQQAMQDGFSTGKSLGLGLPGARRLVNEFNISSTPGQGTTVTVIHWKHGR
ncbi:anti-sigma regulatory factor [Pontibacter ruber]|uniref:Anti-sigma regulatory factor n=1 Tax=Pontibacter ruber TaxID=1343895 RepID=A0ABW5CUZ7_9BACT|nr:anti-sigma regulatory factor [Pontibacter ruber]